MHLLDKNRPFGHIYGHPNALFEQDGQLFDGSGKPAQEEERDAELTDEQTAVGEWLKATLDGGAMRQNEVYKAAENAGHAWDDVKAVMSSIGVKPYRYKNVDMWKLIPN